jgi:prevent-host-death family protein
MVGIRELKIHLSRYLRKVKNGEAVAISEHGKEIALITPSPRAGGKSGLWELVRQGKVTWSGGKPLGLTLGIRIKGKPLSQTIFEDREDRV